MHSNHLHSAQEADNDARGCDSLVCRFVTAEIVHFGSANRYRVRAFWACISLKSTAQTSNRRAEQKMVRICFQGGRQRQQWLFPDLYQREASLHVSLVRCSTLPPSLVGTLYPMQSTLSRAVKPRLADRSLFPALTVCTHRRTCSRF